MSDDETLARILRRALSRVDDEAFDGGMSYVYLGKREKFECDEDEIGPRLTLDGEVKLTDDEFEVVECVLAGRMRT